VKKLEVMGHREKMLVQIKLEHHCSLHSYEFLSEFHYIFYIILYFLII
jgi:hypothetical protein